MASNPMQRKARNSFLLGMLLMTVILGAILVVMLMFLFNMKKEENIRKDSMVSVYTLAQDVKSGQVITQDMLIKKSVERTLIPSNAFSDLQVFSNYALQDKEGNQIVSSYKNNEVQMKITKNNKEYEVKQEELTSEFYIEVNGDKEFLELTSVPLVAKVVMNKNTVLTLDLISKIDSQVQDDVRKQEYNIISLPVDLASGDYVDVRMTLPSGQDYIVVSKKEVTIPNIDGTDSISTVVMNLTEDEILHMNCAIYDTYRVGGAKLYINKYTDPGLQKAATVTYPINGTTMSLLNSNPNILDKARRELAARYNDNSQNLRNSINENYLQQDEQNDAIKQGITKSITDAVTERQTYLNSLSTSGSTTE